MSVPDYQTLMLPLLRVAAQGETRMADAAAPVGKMLGLPAAAMNEVMPTSNQTVLRNRLHWAKSYLVKAGLIENVALGRFAATQAGHDLLAARPQRIDLAHLKTIPRFAADHRARSVAKQQRRLARKRQRSVPD